MSYCTFDTKVLGIVLDLSLRHTSDGIRLVDHVKQQLINYILDVFEDDDVVYLYHPEIVEGVETVGQHTGAISNYESDGWKFDLSLALKQTLYVIGSEPRGNKVVLLISDRLNSSEPLRKAIQINEKEMLDCQIVLIKVGNSDQSSEPGVSCACLNHPNQLSFCLKEVLYASEDVSCSSNPDPERVQFFSRCDHPVSRTVREGDGLVGLDLPYDPD